MRRWPRKMVPVASVVSLAALAGLALVGAVEPGRVASEACEVQPLAGAWANADPTARDLTRLDVHYTCPEAAQPEDAGASEPKFQIEAWGICGATPCAWGSAPARAPFKVTAPEKLQSRFAHGTVTRMLWLTLAGDELEVRLKSNFAAASRDDAFTTARFRRLVAQ